MRCVSAGLVSLLVLVPALWAQDESKDKKSDQAEQQLQKIQEDAQTEMQKIGRAYSEAKSADEKSKVLDSFRSKLQELDRRCLALVEQHPKSDSALPALMWIIENQVPGKELPESEKAIDILSRDYVQRKEMGPLAESLTRSDSAAAGKLLEAILDKNPSHDVKGQAALSLAQYLQHRSETLEKEKPEESKKLAQQAEKRYEEVVAKYSDVKGQGHRTLGETAKGGLHEMRDLAVGKVAPEIDGKDSDGKSFKLSDYRGKVVVLDFWAGW